MAPRFTGWAGGGHFGWRAPLSVTVADGGSVGGTGERTGSPRAKVSDEAAAWAVKVYVESRDHYLAGDDPAIVSGAYLEDARSAATKARAISFAGVAERHIAERAHKLGEATAAIYRRIARDHLADWAERPVAQITTTDLEVKKKRVRLHRTKDGHRGSDGGCADHAE